MHRNSFFSNFCRLALSMCAYPCEPKTRKYDKSGFYLGQTLNGVLFGWEAHVTRFVINIAVLMASAHHFFSTCIWYNIILARSVSVRFIRSANPFCWGEYGTVAWCTIPAIRHTYAKRLFIYSPPLSFRIHLILVFNLFSIIDLYSMSLLTTSDLCGVVCNYNYIA